MSTESLATGSMESETLAPNRANGDEPRLRLLPRAAGRGSDCCQARKIEQRARC